MKFKVNILTRDSTSESKAVAPPVSDADLVARIRAGEDGAFSRLVEQHWERIFRLVLGIVGDWHLSEDVSQEVFLQAFRKLDGFDGRSTLMTWLYRVAINASLKARARKSRTSCLPLVRSFDRQNVEPPVGEAFEKRELTEKLLRCLSPSMRALVLLREWEGLPYEEIASILKISRGAVEQRLHRALVELRRVWKPVVKEEWLDGL